MNTNMIARVGNIKKKYQANPCKIYLNSMVRCNENYHHTFLSITLAACSASKEFVDLILSSMMQIGSSSSIMYLSQNLTFIS